MPFPTDSRERIVRTAARLFLTRSYTSVGVADVCAAAQVRKGSFYHYFPSKSELAKAVIDRHAAEFDRRMAGTRHGSPAVRLRAAADAVFTIQSSFEDRFGRIVGCPFGNLAAELATTDDQLRTHLAAVFAAWQDRLAAICWDAAERGVLRPGLDPDRVAYSVLAQMQGLILLAKVRGGSAHDIRDALRDLIDCLLTEPPRNTEPPGNTERPRNGARP